MCKLFKNIALFFTIQFIMLMIGFTILIGSASGQSNPQNYLLLKGKVLNGYTAEIAAFQYFDDTGKWDMIYSKKNKTYYSFLLNPQQNYQIFFLSNDGQVKVLHIDAGNKGMWEKEVDVDFDKVNIKHAKIYQALSRSEYNIVMVSNEYINEEQNKMIKGTTPPTPNKKD